MRMPYPLKNKQATKVILVIVNGKTNTNEIAKVIGVKRSTVYDIMAPYSKRGVIKKKEKRFEIDWEEFYKLFITAGVTATYYELIEKALTGSKKDADEMRKISTLLEENESVLKEFITGYIKNIGEKYKGGEREIEFTMQDSIDDFWTAIPFLLKKYGSKQIKNKRKKAILLCLGKLQDIFISMSAPATDSLEKSFNSVR